jgi:ribonuclease Z
MHVNVWPNRLAELGPAPGAWLRDAKRAIIAEAPDDTRVTARWRAGTTIREESLSLGMLRQVAMQCVPGQKIAYGSDVVRHAGNVQRITRLATDADLLFIEATFLDRDADCEDALVSEARAAFRGAPREGGQTATVPCSHRHRRRGIAG